MLVGDGPQDAPPPYRDLVNPELLWAISEDRQTIKVDVAFHRYSVNQLTEVSDRFHLFAGN